MKKKQKLLHEYNNQKLIQEYFLQEYNFFNIANGV